MVKSKLSMSGKAYKAVPEGHLIKLEWLGGSLTSYGEGWENGYHVYLTDDVGGKYVNGGTVGDITIGELYYHRPPHAPERVVRVKTAHIYPNGRFDFNVEKNPGKENSDSIQVNPKNLFKYRA